MDEILGGLVGLEPLPVLTLEPFLPVRDYLAAGPAIPYRYCRVQHSVCPSGLNTAVRLQRNIYRGIMGTASHGRKTRYRGGRPEIVGSGITGRIILYRRA